MTPPAFSGGRFLFRPAFPFTGRLRGAFHNRCRFRVVSGAFRMFADPLLLLFPAAMAFAGAMDLFTMTIPNRVPLVLVASFVCLAPFAGFSWVQAGYHAGVGLAALAVGILCFARGWVGGGDAKLFAAAALWFGPTHVLQYLLVASVIGGALTLFVLIARRLPLPAGLARQGWLARLHDTGEGVPYGVALAGAALIVYPQTMWMAGPA